MDFGRLLWAARRAKGWSQRDLAHHAGIPQSTVARIETGALRPRTDTAARLATALRVEIVLVPRLGDGIDRSLIRRHLELSPHDRILYSASAGVATRRLQQATVASRRS